MHNGSPCVRVAPIATSGHETSAKKPTELSGRQGSLAGPSAGRRRGSCRAQGLTGRAAAPGPGRWALESRLLQLEPRSSRPSTANPELQGGVRVPPEAEKTGGRRQEGARGRVALLRISMVHQPTTKRPDFLSCPWPVVSGLHRKRTRTLSPQIWELREGQGGEACSPPHYLRHLEGRGNLRIHEKTRPPEHRSRPRPSRGRLVRRGRGRDTFAYS